MAHCVHANSGVTAKPEVAVVEDEKHEVTWMGLLCITKEILEEEDEKHEVEKSLGERGY